MFSPNTKILVVDDMKTMRMVVKKNLNSLGFQDLTEASDGEAAFILFETALSQMDPFQLIVSDWTMPKMTGLEFLKKVRANPKAGKTPFLMITAEADAALVKQAIEAGVSNYITKPFTADQLKEKLTMVHAQLLKKSA